MCEHAGWTQEMSLPAVSPPEEEEVVDQPLPAILKVPVQSYPSNPWHHCYDHHYSIIFFDFAMSQMTPHKNFTWLAS